MREVSVASLGLKWTSEDHMSDVQLPLEGQTYQHKEYGPLTVTEVRKRGRGYYVVARYTAIDGEGSIRLRLKDWNRHTK